MLPTPTTALRRTNTVMHRVGVMPSVAMSSDVMRPSSVLRAGGVLMRSATTTHVTVGAETGVLDVYAGQIRQPLNKLAAIRV
jgi:hypothetical protein